MRGPVRFREGGDAMGWGWTMHGVTTFCVKYVTEKEVTSLRKPRAEGGNIFILVRTRGPDPHPGSQAARCQV